MIYTLTFNPALDYAVGVKDLVTGMTNRTCFEQLLPGGKGLNVSTVLNNLNIDNIALGFIAGFTGMEIKRSFEEAGGKSDFIVLKDGISRINIKIKASAETEINASGPMIDAQSLAQLMDKLNHLKAGDILVLAGSIPSSLSASLYSDIAKLLSDKAVMIAVDAENELLRGTLPYRPFLVKPNIHELGEIFGVTLTTGEEAVPYAKMLQKEGAKNVLVSMAGEGAALVADTGSVLMSGAPKGEVKNSVGAGDAMVAGFIAGWCQTQNYEHAFRLGLASGSASAFSERLATKPEIENIYSLLMPQRLYRA